MRSRTVRGWVATLVVIGNACGGASATRRGAGDAESCADVVATGARSARVVTTVAPITSIVSSIAADSSVEVTGIVPEGINSHIYEPTPSAAAATERADLLIMNGLGLEAPTLELARANRGDGVAICQLGDAVLPKDEYLFDFSFPEAAGLPNPHLWTNPPMVRDYADVIRDVLSALAPDDAARFASNHATFVAQVDALDAATRQATATIPAERRILLTYHDAYAYFAEEYDWTVLGAVQPSSFAEPTPRELAALVDQIESSDVTAIFGSEEFPSPVLAQLAAETGVEYVDDLRDDDLPGDPGDPEHSWLALMRLNLVTLIEAIGGDATPLRALDVGDASTDAARYP